MIQPPDLGKANVVLHHRRALVLQILDVHVHEESHLVGGALPVFQAEAVEREIIRSAAMLAEARAFGDDVTDGLGTFLMPPDALKPPAHSPSAVAVHDDRNM